ncbi:hypothetical protein [Sporosarcina sp. HYO08]|uniref:hypothetical protein n=1 Tax=Sporosarcina sp. HYO08 TaxID=1759557 RepID=UPI00079C7A65|nr:hypothetical protein [Sporosarcina sp. HYO08]KXH87117.1 hypothetical protein AU377_00635 [Sporosarcina sp. HYO08]
MELTPILIVAIVMTVPIVAIFTEHNRRITRMKAEFLKEEIELEKLKQQNYVLETEKMKLELDKMKLEYSTKQKIH